MHGINRKANIDAMMSCVTKVDEAANPDDALALQHPEDDPIPDLSTAVAAAKRAIAMVSVDCVRDVPITFEKWVSCLPDEELNMVTRSYLHYIAASSEWMRQTGESDGKGRKKQNNDTITGRAIKKAAQ